MNILIIDDSKVISKAVTQMLNKRYSNIFAAYNGLEAIDLIKKTKIDFIFLDWNMPKMSGIEFLKENHQKKFIDCPIVMMTTENSPEKIQEAMKFGAKEYIMKPFTEDVLFSKIDQVLEGFL